MLQQEFSGASAYWRDHEKKHCRIFDSKPQSPRNKKPFEHYQAAVEMINDLEMKGFGGLQVVKHHTDYYVVDCN
jgi:hypothetical protein